MFAITVALVVLFLGCTVDLVNARVQRPKRPTCEQFEAHMIFESLTPDSRTVTAIYIDIEEWKKFQHNMERMRRYTEALENAPVWRDSDGK